MQTDCYFCHIKTIENLVRKFTTEGEEAEDIIVSMHKLIDDNMSTANPLLATKIHRLAREKFNNTKLYSEEKFNANKQLNDNYLYWKNYIDSSAKPFNTAAKLAVIGNIIDYGAHCLKKDILVHIEELLLKDLTIDYSDLLKKELDKAKTVLYLGDNAGEIVFDKLFIETINHPNVYYTYRGAPVINDITIDDINYMEMEKLCKPISNGYDAPSTLLEHCSDEFLEVYNKADVIISKGQGNFEGLMNEKHLNTFFMLIAKCKPMAGLLGVEKNNMLITKL